MFFLAATFFNFIHSSAVFLIARSSVPASFKIDQLNYEQTFIVFWSEKTFNSFTSNFFDICKPHFLLEFVETVIFLLQNLESPFSIIWEIDEEKLAALKDSKGGFLSLPLFTDSKIRSKCSLEIYPDGLDEDERGQTWLYFVVKPGKKEMVKAQLKFGIQSIGKSWSAKCNRATYGKWGAYWCTTTQLVDPEMKFLVDGKLIVKCDGTLSLEKKPPGNGTEITDNGGKLTLDVRISL